MSSGSRKPCEAGKRHKGSPLDRERRRPDDEWIAARLMESVREVMQNPQWQTVRDVRLPVG